LTEDDVRNPSKIFDKLINDYIDGNLGGSRFLYRAVVVEIDHDRWQV